MTTFMQEFERRLSQKRYRDGGIARICVMAENKLENKSLHVHLVNDIIQI